MNNPQNKAASTRVLLSYAREDDEAFVKRLYADLTNAGFTVWFDRESLMSRGLSFHQEIKDAIRTEVDRVIYVGGPKAALSAYVREEWQFALECDHVVVTPILRLGDYEHVPGELSLLHCEDFRNDAKYPAALAKLIASLRQPNPKLGALFAVPNLPPNFLGRPELMRRVRDALLVDLQKPQVITGADARVGMQGMGGIGKSVLAAALARNRQVRQAYPDGVVWIAAGQKLTDGDLLKRQRDLARHLGGDDTFASLAQGQGVLRQLLAAKAVLLVLDDVWRAADAKPFDVLGPRCRMLVTTRDKGILDTLHGELVQVSLFTEPESLQLLADAVNVAPAALPAEAREVARECGLLPLALALCGGMAKSGHAWTEIVEALREADLEWPENREAVEQHRTIWNAMKASYDALPDEQKPRFAELSVFATDQTVPEAAAATLWEHTGQVSAWNTSKLLINLAERSLVQLDQKTEADGKVRRRFRLHDLLHDYAVRVAGEPRAIHQKLLDAYRKKCPGGWHTGPNDNYFFENLVHHHAEFGAWPEAEKLTTDFSWLMRKCEIGLLDSISHDYELLQEVAPADMKQPLEMWNGFFREKGHLLRRGKQEWPAHKILLQLAVEHAADSPLTLGAEQWLADNRCDWLWLRRVPRLSHVQKNPCLVVLEVHTDTVLGALVLPEGRLLSWSCDHTLRLWDSQSGSCLRTLEGHTGHIMGALALADGRLLSWSSDETLRLWDGQSGDCLAVLEGHAREILGALGLADGRLLSWSRDKTLRLWDDHSGACLAVLEGHTGEISGALGLADGRLLSWSGDETLRLWDGQSGACLEVLEGHTSIVVGALALANGRLLSWSVDKTLRLWDGQSGDCLAVLVGHTSIVMGALALADGRLLSWSHDKTLRLWDDQSWDCLVVLEGHTGCVMGALALADGRLLSWSHDKTLRLWDGQSGDCLAVLEGHTGGVRSTLVLADGRLLSWSSDNTLRLWDGRGGTCLQTFEGHAGEVMGALALADGRLLSWSDDKTLRLWDDQSWACLVVLEGHTGYVMGALALADGRLLSWSVDKTLRLWDGQSGSCLAVLEGHTRRVGGAVVLDDGQLLSWSWDRTWRLWEGQSGACLEVVPEGNEGQRHPDWRDARIKAKSSKCVFQNFAADSSASTAYLRHKVFPSSLAVWHADSDARAWFLFADARIVVTQANGQVCILKLHHGNRRITLAEAEAMLTERQKAE